MKAGELSQRHGQIGEALVCFRRSSVRVVLSSVALILRQLLKQREEGYQGAGLRE